jgi:hypothetical protein
LDNKFIEKHECLIRQYDELKSKADSIDVVDEETYRLKKQLTKELAAVYVEIVRMNIRRMGMVDLPAE